MRSRYFTKPTLILSLLLSCFSFVKSQVSVNEADDFLCRSEYYSVHSQYDSILYYADPAIKAFEKAGDWDSYIRTLMTKGGALREKRLLPEAQEVFEKALFGAMSSLHSSDPVFTNLYAELGLLSLWQTNYPEAIGWFSKQIKADPEKNSVSVAGAEINMGLVYMYLWRFPECRTHCEIGIEILKKLDKASHPYVSNAYMNIGLAYSNEEEFELAQAYYEKALEILQKAEVPNKGAIANVYGNLGNINENLENFDLAIFYLEKSLKLQKETWGEKHTWVAHCYHNLGRIHSGKNNIALAIEYTQKALDIRNALLPEHHKDIIKSYNFLGTCYKKKGQYDWAIAAIQKGISLRQQVAPQAIELVLAHHELSDVYKIQGNYAGAIQEIDKAIFILKSEAGWDQVKNGPRLVSYFTLKAKYLEKYADTQEPTQKIITQKEALSCYQNACELSNYVQRQRHDNASKNKIAKSGQQYGQNGLTLAYALYEQNPAAENLEQVFWFMENNKASLLHEAVQKSQAQLLAGIPDTLRELERTLSLDFSFYEQQLEHEVSLGHEADTVQLKKLKQKTFDLRTQRDSLRTSLEKNYPAFHWLAFEAQQANLATVQAQLTSPAELVVEYAFGDSVLYIIAIHQKETKAFHLNWKKADEQLAEQFIAFLHDSQRAQNQGFEDVYLRDYAALGWPLYQKLLAPTLSAFPQAQQLTIIPDRALGHLPFEAMLTKPLPSPQTNSYSDLAFLLKTFRVKYNYSASLPSSDSLLRQRPSGSLAAFAPQYEGAIMASTREILQRFASEKDAQFGRLPATELEVTQIHNMMGGEVWSGAAASKQTFLQEAGQYRFLHLAMHAFTNDSLPLQSGLVFAPGADRFLYTYEIYNLPLRAELTVLSACHTGFGKYQQGEGIMSLARAFRYAGSPNIVMSLWQADDESTALLMTSFYQHLKDGLGKDEALRQAKLDFIEDGGKPMPYYWAGFVLMGDGEKVEMGEGISPLLWGGGILALILMIWYGWRRIKSKRQD